jgi:CheY-like chemotaxis protein
VNGEAADHHCTILVVDDDRDVQELLRIALGGDGYGVASAGTGRDAIDYLRSHADVCAIVLDLLLPEMDGVEFREVQRRDRSLAWIPVIVMSAAVDADRRARELGVFQAVRKPLDLDELRRVLHLVTRKNCRNAALAAELAGGKGRPLSSG